MKQSCAARRVDSIEDPMSDEMRGARARLPETIEWGVMDIGAMQLFFRTDQFDVPFGGPGGDVLPP